MLCFHSSFTTWMAYQSIDFIMAYTQAKVKMDIYLQLPKPWSQFNQASAENLYGLKDGQGTWHEHIKAGLKEQGFCQSTVDPCLFIKHKVLLVLYIDDAAFFSPNAKDIDDEIVFLQKSFDMTDEGKLQDYLGTHFIGILTESSNFNNKKQLIIASILLAWAHQLTL